MPPWRKSAHVVNQPKGPGTTYGAAPAVRGISTPIPPLFIFESDSMPSAPRSGAIPAAFNSSYPASSGGSATSRTPTQPFPNQPPVHPLEPYGATNRTQSSNQLGSSNYVYSQPHRTDADSLARSFGQLSTTGYGNYSQPLTPPPRTSSVTQGNLFLIMQERWTDLGSTDVRPSQRPDIRLR